MQLTVIYRGVSFEVEFDYQPEEKQTRDDPGCPESISITCIEHKGTDFTEFFTQYGTNESIKEAMNRFEELLQEQRIEEMQNR